MASTFEYSHKLILPMVDSFHDALAAFLQTCDNGAWTVDEQQASNQFKCHFIRGNWGTSFFGLGSKRVPGACEYRSDEPIIETMPISLGVTIRPSRNEIRVVLAYAVYPQIALTNGIAECHIRADEEPRPDRPITRNAWNYYKVVVTNEVNDFRNYLQECFGLSEPPKLETD
jgi:hypothetical protein